MGFIKDEVARNMLAQHMRDCELGREEDRRDRDEDRRIREALAAEVARKLELQNAMTMQMHEQNQARLAKEEREAHARFVKIMCVLVSMLMTALGTLAYAIFKGLAPHVL
jgi:hypothetical protein